MDSSKNGVIYVSFGTNVLPSILQPEKIQVMVKVLSELPYDVLWKWDKDTLPGQSKNIKIAKWFPQTDVLREYFKVNNKQMIKINILVIKKIELTDA